MTENLPAPAWFNPREILTQVIEGKKTEDIAASLDISKEKLLYFLRTRATEDWKEAQVIRAIKRKEEAEDAIDNSTDMLELNKAREKLKSAQWDLERVCRRIYGADALKEPDSKISIVLNIGSDNTAEKVVAEIKPAEPAHPYGPPLDM